ncbi:MAG: asparagine synthase (glutamine-hydrolyzing) [Lachnospiraceae bacterium]|jgi:asparagine synthase (glutamine-hydrolysing)|nr:asparagine synthase (glutamine-hydrolyzing) [Lachnospiraceae bacterium]
MCGIAGLIHYGKTSEQALRNMDRMRARMVHRGPDDGGTWISPDGGVVLGHQRLSIVDLSECGAQPMHSHSGRYSIVYNGEVYNYGEIRDKLLADKYVTEFRGTSDTEVLLEAFEYYGLRETLRLCRGMFAACLYDEQEKTLTLMRDRLGEKPLYYGFAEEDGKKADESSPFVFASDPGSIAAIEGFSNSIDKRVLPFYFERGYIPAPYSIYRNIYKLLPGTIMTVKITDDGVSVGEPSEFWSLTDVATKGQSQSGLFKGTRTEAADELERLIGDSIKGQMEADVPVGAFLSAGIDSSTVVSLMQQEMGSRKVRTFTIGMENREYNEADYASEIAAHLGTDHTELYISDKEAKDVIPLLPSMFAEPFADSSQIPTYLVSRMTREHVTVSLSGDAGDELFAGYNSYLWAAEKWNKVKHIPLKFRAPFEKTMMARGSGDEENARLWRGRGLLLGACDPIDVQDMNYHMDSLVEKIALPPGVSEDLVFASRSCGSGLDIPASEISEDVTGETYHDLMLEDMMLYLPDDILAKVDRTSMAVSLETRVPLLDRDVVEFAWTLPVEYLRGTDDKGAPEGKQILRDVLYRHVPKEMMTRPKKGFSVPVKKWLKEPELRSWAEDLLSGERIAKQGLLDPDVVKKIWDDYITKDVWRPAIWYLLMFEAWLDKSERLC